MKRLALLLAFSAACGGSNTNNADGNNIDPSMRYEPWSVGAVWEYKLTDPATNISAMNKKTTMMAEMDVGGVHAGTLAYVAHIEKLNGAKDVWEVLMGDLDIRYKTVQYDANGAVTETDVDQPYRLKLDESAAHTVTGAQWSESFTEITTLPGGAPTSKAKMEQWRVVNAAEQITVIAGAYTTLHVQRTDTGGLVQDYWYARGVGKVKETGGSGQNEELMSYTPGQ